MQKASGTKVSSRNLKDQFGQEYNDPKDFEKKFRIALAQVCVVYLVPKYKRFLVVSC